MTDGDGNISYTKFLFVHVNRDDDAAAARMRTASGQLARGFSNDFDADGSRDAQSHETIQFLVAEGNVEGQPGLGGAQYAVQVSAKYRARLEEVERELKRRLGDTAQVIAVDGAERKPRYTSSEMHDYAYRNARTRRSGRVDGNAFILPLSKTAEWWDMSALERQGYFYPHVDQGSGCPVAGHARTAERGIATLYRRLYHNPHGYGREGEFDFLTYFECEDDQVCTFESVHRALRDTSQNPEWRFVQEGPLWRGRRALRW